MTLTTIEAKYSMQRGRNPQKIVETTVGSVTTTYIGECPKSWAADTDEVRRIKKITEDSSTGTSKIEFPKVAGKDPTGALFAWASRETYSYTFDA